MASPKRQIALENELKQLNHINMIISDLIGSIKITKNNITRTNEATENTDKLVNQWIRILSQSQYTSETLQNPHWNGASEFDEEEIELKSAEEQELTVELNELLDENTVLSQKLRDKESKEKQEQQRLQAIAAKRHQELGLRNVPRKRLAQGKFR